jgi:AraC family transcriptional regulator
MVAPYTVHRIRDGMIAKNVKNYFVQSATILCMVIKRTTQLKAVAEAIEFIESNLDKPLSGEAVSAHVGFSSYHFHRIFSALVGESVVEYMRKRRLSEASQMLRSTDRPLLEIAFQFGFESQEVFTRAFKKMFGITPGRYRALRDITPYPEKVKATMQMLEFLQGGITMEPRIITRDAERVIGMGSSFEQGDSQSIGKLWDRFLPVMDSIVGGTQPYAIGVCAPRHPDIPLKGADQMVYIAAVPVGASDMAPPPGMVACELAAGRYAVFTHKGPIMEISHTLNYIWGTWMAKGEFEHRDAPDFELYDERFNPNSADSEMDFYIPIK